METIVHNYYNILLLLISFENICKKIQSRGGIAQGLVKTSIFNKIEPDDTSLSSSSSSTGSSVFKRSSMSIHVAYNEYASRGEKNLRIAIARFTCRNKSRDKNRRAWLAVRPRGKSWLPTREEVLRRKERFSFREKFIECGNRSGSHREDATASSPEGRGGGRRSEEESVQQGRTVTSVEYNEPVRAAAGRHERVGVWPSWDLARDRAGFSSRGFHRQDLGAAEEVLAELQVPRQESTDGKSWPFESHIRDFSHLVSLAWN